MDSSATSAQLPHVVSEPPTCCLGGSLCTGLRAAAVVAVAHCSMSTADNIESRMRMHGTTVARGHKRFDSAMRTCSVEVPLRGPQRGAGLLLSDAADHLAQLRDHRLLRGFDFSLTAARGCGPRAAARQGGWTLSRSRKAATLRGRWALRDGWRIIPRSAGAREEREVQPQGGVIRPARAARRAAAEFLQQSALLCVKLHHGARRRRWGL